MRLHLYLSVVASAHVATCMTFSTTAIVANLNTSGAFITDPKLKDAWGISFAPTGPFWVTCTGSGISTVYKVSGATHTKLNLEVTIPGFSPTGQAFNGDATSFNGDQFLFVAADGTVSGWRGALGTTAEVLRPANLGDAYTGTTIVVVQNHSYLLSANVEKGTIDVLKGKATNPNLAGSFVDPNLPKGFTPFNVQVIGDRVYVAYGEPNGPGENVYAPGAGVVNRFDLQGNFVTRVATGGTLNSPWGLAQAPSSFGAWAGALLVGNFGGPGQIQAFGWDDNQFLGLVLGLDGRPWASDGLWALTPGNGGSAGSTSLLYFSAGPNEEQDGLLGVLTPGYTESSGACPSGYFEITQEATCRAAAEAFGRDFRPTIWEANRRCHGLPQVDSQPQGAKQAKGDQQLPARSVYFGAPLSGTTNLCASQAALAVVHAPSKQAGKGDKSKDRPNAKDRAFGLPQGFVVLGFSIVTVGGIAIYKKRSAVAASFPEPSLPTTQAPVALQLQV